MINEGRQDVVRAGNEVKVDKSRQDKVRSVEVSAGYKV